MIFRMLKDLYGLLIDKKYTTLAGSISFFFLINGGATVFLIILIIQSFNIESSIIFMDVNYLPSEIKEFVTYILNESKSFSNGYSLVFIFTSIWGASNLFYQLLQTGEFIFGKPHKSSGLFRRAISIIIMSLFIFVLVISIIMVTIVNYLISNLATEFVIAIWQRLASIIIPFILLTFINLYIPPNTIKMRGAILGGLFTAFFWLLSSSLFSIYLTYFSNIKELYGALTFLIVFMLWIYLLTIGIIIGFVINYRFQKKAGNERLIVDTI